MRIHLPVFTFQERQNSSALVMIFPPFITHAESINASHAVSSPCSRKVERRPLMPDAVTDHPARSGGFPPASVLSVRITDKERLHWRRGRVLPAGAVRRHHNLNRIASTGSDCRHCRQNDHPMYSVLCHLLSQSRAVFHGRHQPAC